MCSQHGQLDQIMKSRDHDVNSIPGVTCRVWLMTILQQLTQQGIVQCSDRDALQQECMTFGNQYSAGAAGNSQPRPVVRSALCLWPCKHALYDSSCRLNENIEPISTLQHEFNIVLQKEKGKGTY
jgi:hypothetical protein